MEILRRSCDGELCLLHFETRHSRRDCFKVCMAGVGRYAKFSTVCFFGLRAAVRPSFNWCNPLENSQHFKRFVASGGVSEEWMAACGQKRKFDNLAQSGQPSASGAMIR